MQDKNSAFSIARIAYVGGDKEALEALASAFADAGYSLVSHEDAQKADIGLIDLRGKQLSSKKAQAVAGQLRKSSPDSSILILIDPYIDATARKALRRHGELVTILTKPEGLIERCRQILRLRNIAEETGERLKSLATLSRLNEFPPIAAPSTPLRVLIAGEAGPTALAAINALKPISEQCVCVFSAGQALRAIENSKFDCAVFLPTRENDPLMSLARALRRHPKHASMPIIFPLPDPDDMAVFVERGASDFILTDHVAADLAPKVQLATRRTRLLKSMRRFLNSCVGEGVRDAASGAFTTNFLTEHGSRICARADQTDHQLSMIVLRLYSSAKGSGEPEPGRRALHQAARLINRVTRAEDLVARIANDTFLVLAPATNEAEATKTALRIQGVIENTVFRSADDELLYGIEVDIAACTRPQGLCIEESVAFALATLREYPSGQVQSS
ncbi:diguanylate cyclase [Hyphococcus formosus]|uniref:GGDEF domain-containing response regulator n=1 Tax=Hyphococcus formosus TaxID=3143534 RepID=UPI00398B4446